MAGLPDTFCRVKPAAGTEVSHGTFEKKEKKKHLKLCSGPPDDGDNEAIGWNIKVKGRMLMTEISKLKTQSFPAPSES